MTRTSARHLLLLALAASAPIALGIAMHEEHLAVQRAVAAQACDVEVVAVPTPVAIATPIVQAPEPTPITEPVALPIPLTYGEAFAFIEDIGGPHVVLAMEIDERWIAGEPRLIATDAVRRAVDLDALPDEITARLGASFHGYTAEGLACTGTLGTPFLHAAAENWESYVDEEERVVLDRPGWAWAEGRRILVAPLDGAGDCAGAIWARAAELPPPAFPTAVVRPTKTQVQAARRGYLQTSQVRAAALEFDTSMLETGTAPDSSLGRPAQLRDRLSSTAWDLGGDGVDMVVLDIDGPEFGGCGGFESAWALAVVQHDGANVQRIVHDDRGHGHVLGLVDVDGDGTAELLTGPRGGWEGRKLLRLADDGLQPIAVLEDIPFFGCPC